MKFSETARNKGLQRVQATYAVREISRQFGLSEQSIRRWAREGKIPATVASDGELRFDFQALTQFRRIRELRKRGLTARQVEAELHGQLNLFPEQGGRLIHLPKRISPFEEALILHEKGDARAVEMYMKAIRAGECISDAYCNLGILAYEANNIPEAFDHFTSALQFDPRHFESHFNLAHLYFEAGDFRLAGLHYDISAVIEPGNTGVHFNLGLISAINGDIRSAIASLNRAREFATDEELPQIEEMLAGMRNPVNDSQ
ncbi:MAG TPA: tetratricopeptide repeat protein [Acidobacteriota bacterium]|nr:tetratricopeptide repeat protein [Acidobacteriota bacterium]